MENDERPLPAGWIKQWDSAQHHVFYVDAQASPPRAIWIHPLDDDDFLEAHPEVKDKGPSFLRPPSYSAATATRPSSYHGDSSSRPSGSENVQGPASQKRGFLGKLKDKAIGTKEVREAQKAQDKAQRQERRRQFELMQRQQEEQQRRQYEQHLEQQQQFARHRRNSDPLCAGYGRGHPGLYNGSYAAPYGDPYGYGGPSYGRSRGGGGSLAMPLLGGLAGGLLLGDVLNGGLGGGGGFDNGFGGGGFF